MLGQIAFLILQCNCEKKAQCDSFIVLRNIQEKCVSSNLEKKMYVLLCKTVHIILKKNPTTNFSKIVSIGNKTSFLHNFKARRLYTVAALVMQSMNCLWRMVIGWPDETRTGLNLWRHGKLNLSNQLYYYHY